MLRPISISISRLKVSPSYGPEKLASGSIDDKIDVFEDRIRHWTFTHALALFQDDYQHLEHAGYAVLTLLTSYFELIESCYVGKASKSKSKEFFIRGLYRVFPEFKDLLIANGVTNPDVPDILAESVYSELRCGLYHEGFARRRVVVSDEMNIALGFALDATHYPYHTSKDSHIGWIMISPTPFIIQVIDHFSTFLAEVRDRSNAGLRANFEKFFDGMEESSK